MHAPSRRAPRARALPLLGALCAALAAPVAQAQLVDWFWEPQGSSLDMQQGSNWRNTATSAPATTTPNSQVRGRSNGNHIQGELSGLVTLGSLQLDHGLQLRGTTPDAALVLGNDQSNASLMVGADGQAMSGSASFAALSVLSSGNALIHGANWLYLRDQTAWTHQGTLVIGASAAPAAHATDGAWLKMDGGSTLGPGFETLDVVVGSAGMGWLSAYNGAQVLAQTLTVGAGSPQPERDAVEIVGGRVEVLRTMQIGRLNGALVQVDAAADGRRGELVAERVQLGGASGGASQLMLWAGGDARLNTLAVGDLAQSQGHVQADAGSLLEVHNTLYVGGEGQGTVVVHGQLVANAVQIGSWNATGSGLLSTAGPAQFGRVGMSARSTWITAGQTLVDDTVTVAEYGGRDVLLRVAPGGELHIARDLWVGDYHYFETQPVDQRVVVEPGARLVVDGGISLYATAALSGGGTVVTPSLRVYDGTVAPGMSPGHLTIDGNVSFSGGELVIELGGLQPGTEHDLLEVLGTLTLDQWGNGTTLVLKAVDGFVPQAGQGFDFLRATQVEGSFTSLIDETGLGLTLADLQFSDGHIGINLSAAVPEPHAALLMLLGLIALRLRHRRTPA